MLVRVVLKNIGDVLSALSSPVHKFWFPYALAPTIHAARISTAYQANARRSPTTLSWGTYIVGYLIMCWGGSLLTHQLLGLPPPVLYSFHPYINYITVHLVLTLLFYVFPTALHPPTLDTILFPLDALVRTGAITSGLALLTIPTRSSASSVHPLLIHSPLTHLIIGALASSGGGILASTLSTWSSTWSLSTPPLLRGGLWGSVDFWGGSLVAAIYGVFTRHEAFSNVTAVLDKMLRLPVVPFISKEGVILLVQLSPSDAKALCAAVLTLLFGVRMWKVHWAAGTGPTAQNNSMKGKA